MLIKLAWRNIWRNRNRSAVIMLSVSVGLISGITVNSLYHGMMSSRIRTVIQTETGHIQLHAKGYAEDKNPALYIKNKTELTERLKRMPEVASFSKRVVTAGMLTTATGSAGVNIIGIQLDEEDRVSGLKNKIIEGQITWADQKKGLLMGKKLLSKLKLKIGSKIVLTTVDTASNLISGAFIIIGCFQSANTPLDEVTVYVNKKDLRALLGLTDEVHEVSVLLRSDEYTDNMVKLLDIAYPQLSVDSWKTLSPETELMAGTINTYSFIILTIIMIALSFGIMNTMMMSVLERRHETGMLMALGMHKNSLLLLILIETLLLTLGGIPFALGIAWVMIKYYGERGIDFSGMGEEMMRSFGFEMAIYPCFPANAIPGIIVIVTATALISSILPIWKSLQMNPIDAIQN